MKIFKTTTYLLSSIISATLLNDVSAGNIHNKATLDISDDNIAEIVDAHQLIINDGDTLEKTGTGVLLISEDQGQLSTNEQDGLSGIISLLAGEIRIGHDNALGNGLKWDGNSAIESALQNYLLMSDQTVLSANANITQPTMPIHLNNSTQNVSITISAGTSTLKLGSISSTDNSHEQTITFTNGYIQTIPLIAQATSDETTYSNHKTTYDGLSNNDVTLVETLQNMNNLRHNILKKYIAAGHLIAFVVSDLVTQLNALPTNDAIAVIGNDKPNLSPSYTLITAPIVSNLLTTISAHNTYNDITLSNTYTQGKSTDSMIVAPLTNLKTSALNQLTQSVMLTDKSAISFTEDMNIPTIRLTSFLVG